MIWYSYKLRSECLFDICAFVCAIHEQEFKDLNIYLINNIIKDTKDGMEWGFDSNITLEELRDIFTRVHVQDLHIMLRTLNYKAIYRFILL